MYLVDTQLDALKEVINIGVGYAAGSLNELVRMPISLHVPEVDVLPLDAVKKDITIFGRKRIASVQLGFTGSLAGSVSLVFPYDSAVKLVSLLTGDEDGGEDVDGIRAATLEETGNIILNGVVGSISNLLKEQISFSIPFYSEQGGMPGRIGRSRSTAGVHVVVARAHFAVAQHEIAGEIFLFFEMDSLVSLVSALDRYIEAPLEAY